MATLYISPGTSLHFKIETGVGTVMSGQAIHDNYLYTLAEVQDWFNYCQDVTFPEFCQEFLCDDEVTFQIVCITDDTDPVNFPFIQLRSDAGALVDELYGTVVDIDQGIFNFTIPFGSYDCPACYYVEIHTPGIDSSEVVCASLGTMTTFTGAATGGNNTAAVSTNPYRSPLRSEQITANAIPVLGSEDVFYCTANFTLTADTWYFTEIWLYQKSDETDFLGETDVYMDVSEFSDAVVALQIHARPQDTPDGWIRCYTLFKTGADVTGHIYLRVDGFGGLPEANGIIYIDDFSLQSASADTILQATSEAICIRTELPCYQKITWDGGTSNCFEMDYTTTPWNNIAYVKGEWHRWRMSDEDFDTSDDSEGDQAVRVARPRKISTYQVFGLPPYMAEKIIIAFKHPSLQIEGLEYKGQTDEITPEWTDFIASFELEMIPDTYPMNFNGC